MEGGEGEGGGDYLRGYGWATIRTPGSGSVKVGGRKNGTERLLDSCIAPGEEVRWFY